MPVADPASTSDWLATDPARAMARLRARHAMVAADLFLPPNARLRDDDRETIAASLAALVGQVEHAIRTHLAGLTDDRPVLAEALAAFDPAVAGPILERAGILRDPVLVAVLAQRAEEGRLVTRLRHMRDRDAGVACAAPAPTAILAADADPVIAAAARALAAVDPVDAMAADLLPAGGALLPAEVQHRLVWRTAAALRHHAIAHHGLTGIEIDMPIAHASTAVLAGYDEGATPGGLAITLARILSQAGRLDAGLATAAIMAGEPRLAGAVLAVRGAIGLAAAWEMMLDPDPSRLLLLCRAADLPVAAAAAIALRLATGVDDEALVDRLDGYDRLTPQQAGAAIGLWRLDPAYREAIVEIVDRPPP